MLKLDPCLRTTNRITAEWECVSCTANISDIVFVMTHFWRYRKFKWGRKVAAEDVVKYCHEREGGNARFWLNGLLATDYCSKLDLCLCNSCKTQRFAVNSYVIYWCYRSHVTLKTLLDLFLLAQHSLQTAANQIFTQREVYTSVWSWIWLSQF